MYGPSLPVLVKPDDPAVHPSSIGPGVVRPIEHAGVKMISLGFVSPTVRILNLFRTMLAHSNCSKLPFSDRLFLLLGFLIEWSPWQRSKWWRGCDERPNGWKSRHPIVSTSNKDIRRTRGNVEYFGSSS